MAQQKKNSKTEKELAFLPPELKDHKRSYLEQVFRLFDHNSNDDTAIQEYVRLLQAEKDFMTEYKKKFEKVNFGQIIRGKITFDDPFIRENSCNFPNVLQAVRQAEKDHTELMKQALSELRSLMYSEHEYRQIKQSEPRSVQKNQLVSGNSTDSRKAGKQHMNDQNSDGPNKTPKLDASVYGRVVQVPLIELEQMNRRIEKQQREIDELSSRLSKFASDQLTRGNPNITDLSDKNRPTKVGEMFGELFDNEWSDAFESLKKIYGDEEDIIFDLLKVVKHAYWFCEKVEKQQLHNITVKMKEGVLLITYMDSCQKQITEQSNELPTLHPATERIARNYRKECALSSVVAVIELFIRIEIQEHFKWGRELSQGLRNYINKTIEILWLMSVQDPPMVLKWPEKGDKMDTSMYAYYGNKGKKVHLAVWPAVLLYKDGPLVSKGFAKPS